MSTKLCFYEIDEASKKSFVNNKSKKSKKKLFLETSQISLKYNVVDMELAVTTVKYLSYFSDKRYIFLAHEWGSIYAKMFTRLGEFMIDKYVYVNIFTLSEVIHNS